MNEDTGGNNPETKNDVKPKRSLIAKRPSSAPDEYVIKRALPKRIDPSTFPILGESEKPLGTIENIEHLLHQYDITVAFDVIKKDVVISIPGLSASKDNYRNVAESELASLGVLNGIYSANFERFIAAIASRNPVNPVMKWIKSKDWDGTDRINELCATVYVREEFTDGFKNLLISKWLLSAIAAIVIPDGFSSRGVLTLQGPQGIGKTRWIAKLIDDKKLSSYCILLDHHMDPNNKDSVINACRHWIVEIGELDSSFKKDIARLKGFITSKEDKIRLPYGKRESVFPRRTVFAATVNEDEFLVDPTGNTRWFCLPCEDIDHTHDIDMQQLWAQVYAEFFKDKNLPQWWLTDEEQTELEKYNNRYKKRTAVDDMLEQTLLFSEPKTRWKRLSASEILKAAGIERPTNVQAKECANFLRQRIGQPRRSQGKTRWLVPPTVKEEFTQHFEGKGSRDEVDDDKY